MFHIKCGMDDEKCGQFKHWLFGQNLAVRIEILTDAERVKMAGLGLESVVKCLEEAYEAHVIHFKSANCYFVVARYIFDETIVFLDYFPAELGRDAVVELAIERTAAHFQLS